MQEAQKRRLPATFSITLPQSKQTRVKCFPLFMVDTIHCVHGHLVDEAILAEPVNLEVVHNQAPEPLKEYHGR